MNDNTMFPKNLSYLLDNNIISVNTLLNITGHKSNGLISMWKTGEREIITKDLVTIANFLGYSVDDLVNKDISKIKKETQLDKDLKKEIKDLSEDNKNFLLTIAKNINQNNQK